MKSDIENRMTPIAREIYQVAVDHCIAVSTETDTPGEWYEFYGIDDDVQYAYQSRDSKRFACLGASLVACRLARDRWLERGCPSELNYRVVR